MEVQHFVTLCNSPAESLHDLSRLTSHLIQLPKQIEKVHTTLKMDNQDHGPITKFPADDLRAARRLITSHNAQGQGVFCVEDDGDHHKVMVRGKGVANIIYSTHENPVDMNDEKDIKYAKANEVSIKRHTFPSQITGCR